MMVHLRATDRARVQAWWVRAEHSETRLPTRPAANDHPTMMRILADSLCRRHLLPRFLQ